MKFRVIPTDRRVPETGRDTAFLWSDGWNDWWEFQTLYVLTYFDRGGVKHEIGGVKIGQFDWKDKQNRPNLPDSFDQLDTRFFSLGQDVGYYTAIFALDADTRTTLLSGLRDIVADSALRPRALDERVARRSLMRSVAMSTIEGQFARVLGGGAPLTEFSFTYAGPAPAGASAPLKLDFNVVPDSTPPTNIHVLIGRNGVGKTYLLNAMTRALVSFQPDPNVDGIFKTITSSPFFTESTDVPFANVVSVTFSAFDEFSDIPGSRTPKGIQYSNIGLRSHTKDQRGNSVVITHDPSELARDFSNSAKVCVVGARSERWRRALSTLETDPIFAEAQVSTLASTEEAQFGRQASQLFKKLSSGHKIVLLTVTELVEKVEEKTLVLMDEPEAHLHPPLLSAFVRALSDLLINRNGVALIATHSPVVLQEVPTSCVWKIVRHGSATRADRPEIETFGENVGTLTREVFSLEVTRSGFHKMIAEEVQTSETMEAVLEKFKNQLGSEGRALISSLIANRSTDEDN